MTNKDSFNGGTNIGVGNTAGGDIYVAGRDVHIQKNGEERPQQGRSVRYYCL